MRVSVLHRRVAVADQIVLADVAWLARSRRSGSDRARFQLGRPWSAGAQEPLALDDPDRYDGIDEPVSVTSVERSVQAMGDLRAMAAERRCPVLC